MKFSDLTECPFAAARNTTPKNTSMVCYVITRVSTVRKRITTLCTRAELQEQSLPR